MLSSLFIMVRQRYLNPGSIGLIRGLQIHKNGVCEYRTLR